MREALLELQDLLAQRRRVCLALARLRRHVAQERLALLQLLSEEPGRRLSGVELARGRVLRGAQLLLVHVATHAHRT